MSGVPRSGMSEEEVRQVLSQVFSKLYPLRLSRPPVLLGQSCLQCPEPTGCGRDLVRGHGLLCLVAGAVSRQPSAVRRRGDGVGDAAGRWRVGGAHTDRGRVGVGGWWARAPALSLGAGVCRGAGQHPGRTGPDALASGGRSGGCGGAVGRLTCVDTAVGMDHSRTKNTLTRQMTGGRPYAAGRRTLRGGAWSHSRRFTRVSPRYFTRPVDSAFDFGVRVVVGPVFRPSGF